MRQSTKDCFESIDAAIFTGDQFDDEMEDIKEAREYFTKWDKELSKKHQYAWSLKCRRHKIFCAAWQDDAIYPDVAAFELDTGLKFKELY